MLVRETCQFRRMMSDANAGVNTAQQLATKFHGRFRVLLIEKNSHFQHLFAFPRFAVTTKVETHKAFIPYTPGTFANCPAGSGLVVQAGVTKISESEVHLNRTVRLNDKDVNSIPYQFLVSKSFLFFCLHLANSPDRSSQQAQD